MQIGTFGYMAPEVLGFFSGNDPAVAYSVTVDIWAIGIITYELLFKRHPFLSVKDMLDYVNDSRQLDLKPASGSTEIIDVCQDFVKSLLSPNPVTRPTAGAASNHTWIGLGAPTPMDVDEESYVARLPYVSDSDVLTRCGTDCSCTMQHQSPKHSSSLPPHPHH
jgi:serine/threonine protein kinase